MTFAFKLYYYCVDLREIYKLGVVGEITDFTYYLLNWYISKVNWFFGFQDMNVIFSSSLKDVEGKSLFDDEIFLFDTQVLNNCVLDFLNNWDLSFNDVDYLVNDRYVSTLVYHYTANAYFFNGRVDISAFFLRKTRPFNQLSNFALFDIVNTMVDKGIYLPQPTTVFTYDSILRDTFFEAQNFKHSLSFEFIWAIFPTAIILSILVPSLYLLYSLDEDLDPKLTIKVIGHQWYWSYEFITE